MSVNRGIEKLRDRGAAQSLWRGLRQLLLYSNSRVICYYIARNFRDCVIRDVNGYRMFLFLKEDAGLSKDLYIYGKRENRTTDFVLSSGIVKEGDAVLDIGANIGYYALLWSALVGQGGRVYAMEPVGDNYNSLVQNMELNLSRNIRAFRLAAGESDSEASMYICGKRNYSAFYSGGLPGHVHKRDIKGRETVKVVKIDGFLEDKRLPTLIRMDIEGHEADVIKGMDRTLEADIALLVEVHMNIMGSDRFREMVYTLKNKGFRGAYVIRDEDTLELASADSNANFLIRGLDRVIRDPKPPPVRKMDILDVLEEKSTCQMFFYKRDFK